MDALSEILQSVKLEGAVFYKAEFTAPWGFRSPPTREVAAFLRKGTKHVIVYHLLIQGRALCEVEHNSHRIELVPGDIVVFPHGDAHVLSNGSLPCILDYGEHLKELFSQGIVLASHGGGGEATSFVCGYMECDRELSKIFLGGLPSVCKVNIRNDNAGQWLQNSIKVAAAEAGANRAGSEAVLARLSEALFVETLRRYMAELPEQQTGWLAGARDPKVGAALAHMHRAPEYRWTIANLAETVGVSRSVLAERFRQLPGRTANDLPRAVAVAARRPNVDHNQLQCGADLRRGWVRIRAGLQSGIQKGIWRSSGAVSDADKIGAKGCTYRKGSNNHPTPHRA